MLRSIPVDAVHAIIELEGRDGPEYVVARHDRWRVGVHTSEAGARAAIPLTDDVLTLLQTAANRRTSPKAITLADLAEALQVRDPATR